jgi:hypothetical protein
VLAGRLLWLMPSAAGGGKVGALAVAPLAAHHTVAQLYCFSCICPTNKTVIAMSAVQRRKGRVGGEGLRVVLFIPGMEIAA